VVTQGRPNQRVHKLVLYDLSLHVEGMTLASQDRPGHLLPADSMRDSARVALWKYTVLFGKHCNVCAEVVLDAALVDARCRHKSDGHPQVP
jgi:hypothetical protein